MFIRRKQIKSRPYAYLVENQWVDGSPKQSVKQYLGRIYDVETGAAADLSSVNPADILSVVIAHETRNADVEVDAEQRSVTRSGRDVVLGLNGGYLCAYTLEQVFRSLHARNEERPGVALAQALSRAGLRVDKESFVRLYLEFQP